MFPQTYLTPLLDRSGGEDMANEELEKEPGPSAKRRCSLNWRYPVEDQHLRGCGYVP